MLAIYIVAALIEFFGFNENWKWDLVWSYMFSERIMRGVLNTVILSLLSTVIGLVLGLVIAACRMSSLPVLRSAAYAYIWIIRAMPLLVLLLLIFFLGALVPTLSIGIPFGPSLPGVPTNEVISRFTAAVVGLSLYLGGKAAEVFRSGILAIDGGQFEACRALGMSPWTAYYNVISPQAIRVITPSMANEVITMFKNSSLVSVIGYAELLTTVQLIYSRNFETIPLLTVAVIWYLFLVSIAMYGQSRLEKRYGRGYNRRAVVRHTEPQVSSTHGQVKVDG